MKRRTFIEFLGKSTALAILPPILLESCTAAKSTQNGNILKHPIQPLLASWKDEIQLIDGLKYDIIVKWQDKISDKDHFGMHNDYITYIKNEGKEDDLIMWVNHEYIMPMLMNHPASNLKTKKQIEAEQYEVGGSIFRIKKDKNNHWKMVFNDMLNRRITAKTIIPFDWKENIYGKSAAEGTLANCAGGITPWGTFLTCEENYDMFYGEKARTMGSSTQYRDEKSLYGWDNFSKNPPQHYGWVVEVNPKTGEAKKHVSLGRIAHEACTIHRCKDGTIIAYTGDDSNDQCLYKYISNKADSLNSGKLYVANIQEGKWISLMYNEQEILRENFIDQTDIMIHVREAAHLVGGSKLDRPEDIEIDPITGDILVALTNNKPRGNFYGGILKIKENDKDKKGLTFESEMYLTGGKAMNFACPDNMEFDKNGNLWFTSDISGGDMPKEPYQFHGNNALFFVPRSGVDAGKVIRVANAPIDAEFTGIKLSPDGRTLFLCVQHPGEYSASLDKLSSHWPEGGNAIPKSALVAIQGDLLNILAEM